MSRAAGFDRDAAVTRSLLGYGVVAGVRRAASVLAGITGADTNNKKRHP